MVKIGNSLHVSSPPGSEFSAKLLRLPTSESLRKRVVRALVPQILPQRNKLGLGDKGILHRKGNADYLSHIVFYEQLEFVMLWYISLRLIG